MANRARNTKFDAETAVKLYKRGATISEIKKVFGYAAGLAGYHRVRSALIRAGVYENHPKTVAVAEKPVVGKPAVSKETVLERKFDELQSTVTMLMRIVVDGGKGALPVPKITEAVEIPENGKAEMSVPVPNDRETLKAECFAIVEDRYKKLDSSARAGWLAEFCGMLWAGLEATTAPHSIAPRVERGITLFDNSGAPIRPQQESIAS